MTTTYRKIWGTELKHGERYVFETSIKDASGFHHHYGPGRIEHTYRGEFVGGCVTVYVVS